MANGAWLCPGGENTPWKTRAEMELGTPGLESSVVPSHSPSAP